MTKTIPSVCIAEYVHKKEDRRILPGDEVIHHDEDTFHRLKKAGCVKEAPALPEAKPDDAKAQAETKSAGGKPPAAASKSGAKTVAKGNGSPDSERS